MENISVNKLVESTNSNLPRDIKVEFAKNILSVNKDPEDAKKEFEQLINKLSLKKQKDVINATGTVLHTNLGRSPVNISFSGMYTNIEYDLTTASRGNRNDYLTESMKILLNVENVAFVNNNASSLYLSLLCLTKIHNKDTVIVSRGEIIEIGGSYRLPDIISETGMNLIEVGTTNKTRLGDYEKALQVLRSRLYQVEVEKQEKERAEQRKSLVSTGDRSAKIRTYNYPQGRITDHRIGKTMYNLSHFMNGDIHEMIDALIMAENAEKLKSGEDKE